MSSLALLDDINSRVLRKNSHTPAKFDNFQVTFGSLRYQRAFLVFKLFDR